MKIIVSTTDQGILKEITEYPLGDIIQQTVTGIDFPTSRPRDGRMSVEQLIEEASTRSQEIQKQNPGVISIGIACDKLVLPHEKFCLEINVAVVHILEDKDGHSHQICRVTIGVEVPKLLIEVSRLCPTEIFGAIPDEDEPGEKTCCLEIRSHNIADDEILRSSLIYALCRIS